jgi:hypothetical protein
LGPIGTPGDPTLPRGQVRQAGEVGAAGGFGAAVAFAVGEAVVGVDLVEEALVEGAAGGHGGLARVVAGVEHVGGHAGAHDALARREGLAPHRRTSSSSSSPPEPRSSIQAPEPTGRVDPPEALVYLALPAARWWDDIITTCSNTMVFFASPEHRDASTLCASNAAGASLTPDQTHTLSVPIYGNRLALDYARPSRQELLDHFAAMGLSGDFWTL